MSRVKDMIIERENTIINLIRRLDSATENVTEDEATEIWDAWCELGLPYDDEDMDILFDIVTDNEVYDYTIHTAEMFLKGIEGDDWMPKD